MRETISQSRLLEQADRPLGPTAWKSVEQERIQQFADATDDHQFIHVDEERAKQTPFGGTIAHGFLSLSLVAGLLEEVSLVPDGFEMGVNYGLNKVRFLAPVRSGSRVRLVGAVKEVSEKGPGRYLVTSSCTLEIEGSDTPALVAEVLVLLVCRPEKVGAPA